MDKEYLREIARRYMALKASNDGKHVTTAQIIAIMQTTP